MHLDNFSNDKDKVQEKRKKGFMCRGNDICYEALIKNFMKRETGTNFFR